MIATAKAHYNGGAIVLDSPVDFAEGQELVVTYVGCEVPAKKRTRENIEAILDEFTGCTHAWDGVDILEYQRQLRGEYRENV